MFQKDLLTKLVLQKDQERHPDMTCFTKRHPDKKKILGPRERSRGQKLIGINTQKIRNHCRPIKF